MSADTRQGAMSLQPSYYDALRRLTLELAGVHLGDNHAFLVETRLSRLARGQGFDSLEAMVNELFMKGASRLALQIVSALTERDTHFFKDETAFKRLREIVLPDLHRKRGGGRVQLLSFGCASGQEAYGMAMTAYDMRKELDGLKVDIVAVDYPSQVLERAKNGRYTHFDVQRGLPIQKLITHFDSVDSDWVVKDHIKEMVEFKETHLLSKLDELDDFHAVMFCGSLPHYSAPARVRVLRGLTNLVKDHGYLILGEGESLSQMNFGFDRVDNQQGIYIKREVIIEPEIDPDLKVHNGRTSFQKAKVIRKSLT